MNLVESAEGSGSAVDLSICVAVAILVYSACGHVMLPCDDVRDQRTKQSQNTYGGPDP